MALDKPIEEVIEADLTSLIAAGTPELKTLDYKRSLPGGSDEDRKDFLADISSFANASGGHLIYGMRADAGVPVELVGVDEGGDGAILRLESLIRDGIDPRIPSIHSTAVKIGNSETAVVIRIPKSFAAPHMVKFKNTSRFYSRASNGKFQLDVHQIRSAFLGSETTTEGIRNFRLDRISRIRARDTAVPLLVGPSAVLHIVPVGAFAGRTRYDVASLKSNNVIYQTLQPLFRDFANYSKINFDGLLVYDVDRNKNSTGFTQLYRTGIIETTDTTLIGSAGNFGHGKTIPSLPFEVRLLKSIRRLLSILESLGVDLPLVLALSLIGVQGYTLNVPDRFGSFSASEPFDREVLAPQEVMIDGYSADLPLVMKSVLDEIWNAAGFPGSIYYRDDAWMGDALARQVGGD